MPVSGARFRALGNCVRRDATKYNPTEYWERRASELISTYDDESLARAKNWNIDSAFEAKFVAAQLRLAGANGVLVAGAGSGRQYEYMKELGLAEVRGFD